jgi:glycosyltransferase involved in cell wall biosynthesis
MVDHMSEEWRSKITIVVLSYNRGHHLEICLQTIFTHAPRIRVLVVDDGSDEPYTQHILQTDGFEKLVRNQGKSNRLGGLYNNMQTALELTNTDYILFMQDDSQFIRDLTSADMQAIQQAFDRAPELAFVNPVISMGPRGQRMKSRAVPAGSGLGFEFPFDGPKPNPCRSFYQDIVLCSVSRLKSKNWVFGPTEDATARRAGKFFSNMLHYQTPFVAQMPEVITQRFGQLSLAAELVNKRLQFKANYFEPLSESTLNLMRGSPTFFLAEDVLTTKYQTIKKPYIHKAVNSVWWIRIINKIEMKIAKLKSKRGR